MDIYLSILKIKWKWISVSIYIDTIEMRWTDQDYKNWMKLILSRYVLGKYEITQYT